MISIIFLKIIGIELSAIYIVSIFFLSYPYKIGENIYSLFGGFNDSGSVYSLFGVIQKGIDDCISLFGISFYQHAGNDSWQGFGVVLFNKSRTIKMKNSIVIYND